MEIRFDTVQELLNFLITNDDRELADNYGRKWKYRKFKFYFQDITDNEYKEGIKCLHLYQTQLRII